MWVRKRPACSGVAEEMDQRQTQRCRGDAAGAKSDGPPCLWKVNHLAAQSRNRTGDILKPRLHAMQCIGNFSAKQC